MEGRDSGEYTVSEDGGGAELRVVEGGETVEPKFEKMPRERSAEGEVETRHLEDHAERREEIIRLREENIRLRDMMPRSRIE